MHNLKELRPGSEGRPEIRIVFALDPWRSAILLIGGGKSGDWSAWHWRAIPAAEALQKAALAELHARRPDRVLATNVEFWAAIVLDFAEVPANMFTSMFTCARTAGWSAHILEQKRTGRLVRPSARYVGPPTRTLDDVQGYRP